MPLALVLKMRSRWLIGIMSHEPECAQGRNGDRYEEKQDETHNFGELKSNLAHSPLAAFIEVDYLHNVVLP
jgi:hypothetical protein